MKREEVLAKFPITVEVTQEIIDKSAVFSTYKCIGANTLRSALPGVNIQWGDTIGQIGFDPMERNINVECDHRMMHFSDSITSEPFPAGTKVTFSVRPSEENERSLADNLT